MKKILLTIGLLFLSSEAFAVQWHFYQTEGEATAACAAYDASHATKICPQGMTTGSDAHGAGICFKGYTNSGSIHDKNYCYHDACVAPQVIDPVTYLCGDPPPRDPAICTANTGKGVNWLGDQAAPYVGDECIDGCTVSDYSGTANGTGPITYTGSYSGGACTGGGVDTYEDTATDQDNCRTVGDDVYCNATATSPPTINGDPVPDYPQPDGASATPDDYTSAADTYNDDSDGTETDVDTNYDNEGEATNIHEDHQTLPPETPVDTNGDGISDSVAKDTDGDGVTDTIVGNDGSTVGGDNPDGSPNDVPPDTPPTNDDGSPNYPEEEEPEEEPPCEDDPATTEDDCSGNDKKTASTPYCQSQPTCEGDVHQCANITQNWQNLCKHMVPEGHDSGTSLQQDLPEDDGTLFYDANNPADNMNFAEIVLDTAGLGLVRTCPSPYEYVLFSDTYSFSYQPICDIAGILSFIILISATLISIGIIMGGKE